MLDFEPRHSQGSLRPFDLDGDFKPLPPDFQMLIRQGNLCRLEPHAEQLPEFLALAPFSITLTSG
jgi:hypothetical protein